MFFLLDQSSICIALEYFLHFLSILVALHISYTKKTYSDMTSIVLPLYVNIGTFIAFPPENAIRVDVRFHTVHYIVSIWLQHNQRIILLFRKG